MDVNFVSMIKWNLIWFDIVIFGKNIYYFKRETRFIFAIYAVFIPHK